MSAPANDGMAKWAEELNRENPGVWQRYFACEREMWVGDGETEPVELVASDWTVHLTKETAERVAQFWTRRGWKAVVTGPHVTESSIYDENGQ